MNKRTFRILLMAMMMSGILSLTVFAENVLVWPVSASRTLSQGLHDGNAIDISAAAGSVIVAAKGGTVTKITYCTQTHYNYGDCNGFGTGLVILGDDGRAYQYAHMQGGSIPSNVYYGARVEAGQQIGRVGSTGYAYGPHLHFGISATKNYWEAGPDPSKENYGPVPASISVGNQSASNITNTNAKLFGTLNKTAGTNCSVCGIYLGTSSSSMTKRNSEAVGSASNNYRGGSGFDIWYDLTGELGIVLTPGTTYYYKIYAVVNGKEYAGPVSSFKTTGTAPVPVTISVGNQSASNITDTNAKLFGTLYKAPGYNCSVCGIYLGTSSASMTKRNTEAVGSASNNYRNGESFDIWYDLTGELGIVLTPGTTYYYKIYAVVNGKEYAGSVKSFKTTGTAPGSVINLRQDISGDSSGSGAAVPSGPDGGNSSGTTPAAPSVPSGSGNSSQMTPAAPSVPSGSASSRTTPSVSSDDSSSRTTVPEGSGNSSTTKKTSKKKQKLKVSPGKTVLKYKKIRKRQQTFRLRITGQKGKLTIKSNSRYIRIKENKVTVVKNTPRGTYKIKVTAAATSAYKAASKTIRIVIK